MEENTIAMKEDPFPYIPKDLLDRIKKDFDIREQIRYIQSRDELMGIQSVVSYLDYRYKEQINKGED